jgi:hypothetical protein
MKTLLSIIAALALMFAFSIPAMAHGPSNTANGTTGAAVANDGMATAGSTLSNMFNDNRKYDSRENTVAMADLKQTNTMTEGGAGKLEARTYGAGAATLTNGVKNFAGIANVNISRSAMNNQAVQNTIAVRVLDIR